MKKLISFIVITALLISTLYVLVFAENSSYENPPVPTGVYKMSSGRSFEYVFDENYFGGSAYSFNNDLAAISVRLAISAFACTDKGYETQYKDVNGFLDKLYFKDIKWNKDYETKPDVNSIGVIAGNKKVSFSDGDYTLIALVIRGGNYEAEWGGNFNAGRGKLHEGFAIARDNTLEFLENYVKEKNISGNIKLWITGYSRGGAVANLTGAYIDENPGCLGKDVKLKTENLFTYTFATPSGVKETSDNSLYSNIFNIINRNDFVPRLMMEEWGYERYGITYYLPYGDDELSQQMSQLSASLAETFGNSDEYAKNYQDAFISFGVNVIGKNKTERFFDELGKELTSKISGTDIAGFVLSMITGSELDSGMYKKYTAAIDTVESRLKITLDENVDRVLFLLIKDVVADRQLNNFLNISDAVTYEHGTEVYLLNIDASEEKDYKVHDEHGAITVSVNDRLVKFDQSPVIENGRTLVPMRKIFEELGASVSWNQDTYTVTAVMENVVVTHKVGSNIINVDGKEKEIDVSSQIVNSRTMVPARAIAESFDCNVNWDNDLRRVVILK